VTTVSPSAFAVTRPDGDTLAMEGFELDQVTVRLGTAMPLEVLGTAANCWVPPGTRPAPGGSMSIRATTRTSLAPVPSEEQAPATVARATGSTLKVLRRDLMLGKATREG
jgi:hypothetical protein